MTTTTQSQMTEVHTRIQAAVARSVARGIGEREAFENHMRAVVAQWPTVAAAYMGWLLAGK